MKTSIRFACAHLLSGLFIFVIFTITGCTVKFISSYDEATDVAVTALHRKVETFFITLESGEGLPGCTYDNHKKFYEEAKVDISAIQVRAEAIPKNEITIQQLKLLSNSLDQLEQLHKLKKKLSDEQGKLICLTRQEIAPLRTAFNASFTAILKLEIAKKRGDIK